MEIIENDRASVFYYSNDYSLERHHNTSMFKDDFGNVTPVRNVLGKCILNPANKQIERKLKDLFPRSGYGDNFEDVIFKFTDSIAASLIEDGFSALEFITKKDINGHVHYSIDHIYGVTVTKIRNFIVQEIPLNIAQERELETEIKIPMEKAFYIEFPDSLGGSKALKKFIEKMKYLDENSPTLNFFKSPLKNTPGYNFIEHQRLSELELWELSKQFQWPHRGDPGHLFTGYYSSYRQLQFKRNQILLRDHIFEKIKEIVSFASEKMGQKSELQIQGLPSIDDIDRCIQLLEEGKVTQKLMTTIIMA